MRLWTTCGASGERNRLSRPGPRSTRYMEKVIGMERIRAHKAERRAMGDKEMVGEKCMISLAGQFARPSRKV